MICIDPGEDCGVAVFFEEQLDDCFLWKLGEHFDPLAIDDDGVPLRLPRTDAVELIIEDQAIYPRSKVNPNDIVQLAKQAGRAAQVLGWDRVQWVEPRTWKGTIAKDTMAVRILEALNASERKVYFEATDKLPEGVRHNVIDAIGIGLWKLGRLGRQNLTRARANGTKGRRRRT